MLSVFQILRHFMKSRFQYEPIKAKAKSPFGRIVVLTGARQTGKTTLAKGCFTDYKYISIEDPMQRGNYTQLTASQWHLFFPKAILDEVQKEPALIESIKSVYDQFSETRYILLGSSQLLLLQKVKESLAGRCIIEDIYPLTLPELLTKKDNETIRLSVFQQFLTNGFLPEFLPEFQLYANFAERKQVFDYYLEFGGYPALTAENISDADRQDWLNNYVRTYLERDIRDLAEFKNLEPFVKTQRITSHITAQLINYSSLAKDADISVKTAQRFLYYLEVSYQILMLQPWHKNTLKRLSKSSKLHYLDPGVQRTIIQKKGEISGNEFESAVVSEIYKQTRCLHFKHLFYHIRTLDGREVDLLIESEKGYIAIEIKMTGRVNNTDCRHLRELDKVLDKPILQSFIISNDLSIKKLDGNVMAIPAAMFLS